MSLALVLQVPALPKCPIAWLAVHAAKDGADGQFGLQPGRAPSTRRFPVRPVLHAAAMPFGSHGNHRLGSDCRNAIGHAGPHGLGNCIGHAIGLRPPDPPARPLGAASRAGRRFRIFAQTLDFGRLLHRSVPEAAPLVELRAACLANLPMSAAWEPRGRELHPEPSACRSGLGAECIGMPARLWKRMWKTRIGITGNRRKGLDPPLVRIMDAASVTGASVRT